MYSKSEIRQLIRQQKKALPTEKINELSKKCVDKLIITNEYINANTICVYINYNQEIVTRDLIMHSFFAGKRVAAPKIINNQMEFFYFNSLDELEPGAFNILEPIGNSCLVDKKALIVMPGLAFDLCRNRIGYGGGFYDRYLEINPCHSKVALAYDFQIVDALETNNYDIKPDLIVTDSRIIR